MATGFVGKRFGDAVHDFAAEAARVDLDWEQLRSCATRFAQWAAPPPGRIGNASAEVRANDWCYLDWVARSHQLDGVIAWRLLDTALDGVVPEEWRATARRELAALRSAGQQYAATAEAVLQPLRDAGIPFIVGSGLPAYGLYGMEEWARPATDLDICVPAQWYHRARVAFGERVSDEGLPYTETFSVAKPAAAEHDEFLEILTHPPTHDHMAAGIYGDEEMFRSVQEIALPGLSLPVPHAEAWFVLQAQRVMEQYEFRGGPVTLWMLARLQAIASRPGFDWGEVVRLLRHFRAKTERRVAWSQERDDVPPEDRPEVIGRGDTPDAVQWVLRLADRVYHFVPQAVWDDLAAFIDPDRLLQVTAWIGPVVNRGVDIERGYALLVEVAPIPDVETFLFAHYHLTRPEDRLAAGMWRRQASEVRVRLDEQPWSVRAGEGSDGEE